MTHTINEVEDPAAVLAIPDEKDVAVIEEILEDEFEQIEPEYNSQILTRKHTARKGSLIQELLAQLHQ